MADPENGDFKILYQNVTFTFTKSASLALDGILVTSVDLARKFVDVAEEPVVEERPDSADRPAAPALPKLAWYVMDPKKAADMKANLEEVFYEHLVPNLGERGARRAYRLNAWRMMIAAVLTPLLSLWDRFGKLLGWG